MKQETLTRAKLGILGPQATAIFDILANVSYLYPPARRPGGFLPSERRWHEAAASLAPMEEIRRRDFQNALRGLAAATR